MQRNTSCNKITLVILVILSTNLVTSFVPLPPTSKICLPLEQTQLHFFGKPQLPSPPPVIQGVGPEGCQLPSPSRVNTLPELAQAKAVAGVFAALALGTAAFSSVLTDLTHSYEWFATNFRASWPIVLGPIFLAAGVSHFLVEEEYCNIYPPRGTWGFWYLPGSAKFHVQWTGVAEILGGAGLLIAGLLDIFGSGSFQVSNGLTSAGLLSDSAAGLFLLTVAVTPSNIYMYTHGARLPIEGAAVPISFHAIRGIMQVFLLSLFYQMGQGTFDALFQH